MPKGLPRIVLIAFLLLLGGIVLQRLFFSDEASQEIAPSVAVEVAAVRVLDMNDYRYFNGTLRPNAQFMITSKVGGLLEKLTVGVGDRVVKGQLIAEVEDDEIAQEVIRIRAQLTVAQAQLAEATASSQVAERDFQRTQQLLERKIASEAEYDGALARVTANRGRLSVARAQLDQAQAALKAAQLRLSYTRIHADWPDEDNERVVGQRFVDAGSLLRPSEPIVQVLALQPITVQANVTERDYERLEIGQRVTVTTAAFEGHEFPGTISRISPQFNELSRQSMMEVDVPNERGELKPGMFARVRIRFGQALSATAVPNEALVDRQGKKGVFLVQEHDGNTVARFIAVETGLQEDNWTQVTAPVLQGQVITLGLHLVDDGQAVKISRVRNL